MNSASEIMNLCREELPRVRDIRRDIHAHPEIGFAVDRTAKVVQLQLQELGLDIRSGVGHSGVVANLDVKGSASYVALRADMDALPMNQESTASYASKNPGKAHMCGHDSHTAMLIGAARILSRLKSEMTSSVRFIFQPNEENLPGGAPAMIKDGALKNVSEIYGLHVWPALKTGLYGYSPGPFMAQPTTFDLIIKGKGGHAGLPHLTQEALIAGVRWVDSVQSIVSRNVDSKERAVLSVTQFHGGSAHNVISKEVKIQGTIRTLKSEVAELVWERMNEITEGLKLAFGVEMELRREIGYPVLVNSLDQKTFVEAVLSALQGSESPRGSQMDPVMGGEDFSYYLQQRPGAFIFLGSSDGSADTSYMCHHPKFNIDEECMLHGMALHVGLALKLN